MKKIIYSLGTSALLALPVMTRAQSSGFESDGGEIGELLRNILEFVNDILIPFILGIGFLVFVFGLFRYFIAGAADEDKRTSGRQLMIYATLAFVLIVIFWGVVNLIAESTGLEGDRLEDVPTVDYLVPNPS